MRPVRSLLEGRGLAARPGAGRTIAARPIAALLALRARVWERLGRLSPVLRSQKGQSMVESSVLLATLLGGLAVGGVALNKTHPDMMNALSIHVRGIYFALSLPFP